MSLEKKNILLCVTGGIAAFKAAALTSKLAQKGAVVKVLMTSHAKQFVTPLTFQTLSQQPVYEDTFDERDSHGIAHIDLADQADLVIVAPATANMIGKMATGIADDLITTTILATKAPVWIAPAMNVNMYDHPIVRKNLKTLVDLGYNLLEPGVGLLACGWVGKGRLAEPGDILTAVESHFNGVAPSILKSQKVLITAGPTQEKIDPVRYLTNYSSGKMGYALAACAAAFGAEVTLVSGPSECAEPDGVTVVHVTTAEEMHQKVMAFFPNQDVVIKAAAVADYRPKIVHAEKLKKTLSEISIEMEPTTDILAKLGKKKNHQILVGFAAETEDLEEYALQKLQKKNLDLIVANRVDQEGSGFGSETNEVVIFRRDQTKRTLPKMIKREVAAVILEEVSALLEGRPE